MLKKFFILFFCFFTTFCFCSSEYDKDIVVKNQTRTEKVKKVFRKMMDAYEEEDINLFFSYVSEDRFHQDYMTFYDAIDEDMRVYDILNIDTYVDKTTEDGVKRFLYVLWEKRYESSKPVGLNQSNLDASSEYEIFQRGTTEFLFDEVNGKYKLIQLSGNNFWGGSLKEWTDEVGDISGQSSKVIVGDNVNGVYSSDTMPDLTVENIVCSGPSTSNVTFDIVNLGGSTSSGFIEFSLQENGTYMTPELYSGDILQNNRVTITTTGTVDCSMFNKVFIDSNNAIVESNESNNEVNY